MVWLFCFTLTLSHTHTLWYTFIYSHTLSHTLIHFYTLWNSLHCFMLSHTLSHSLTFSDTFAYTLIHFHTLSNILIHSHFHTLSGPDDVPGLYSWNSRRLLVLMMLQAARRDVLVRVCCHIYTQGNKKSLFSMAMMLAWGSPSSIAQTQVHINYLMLYRVLLQRRIL